MTANVLEKVLTARPAQSPNTGQDVLALEVFLQTTRGREVAPSVRFRWEYVTKRRAR